LKIKIENDKKLFDSNKILLIGPAVTNKLTKKYLDYKRKTGYIIIAFSSSSLIFLKDIKFCPDFHIFIDPHSYCQSLSKIGGDFFKDINFLGYDILNYPSILSTNKEMFNDPTFGIKDFLSQTNFLNLYQLKPPSLTYRHCFTKNPTTIINYSDKKNKNKKCCLQSELCRFTNGPKEIDKLTYFLLPIIFYWFQKIQHLDLIGFGFFKQERYSGGDKSSYSQYKEAYNKILPYYSQIKFDPHFEISIERESFFYSLIQSIKHNPE
jgi:predicted transport protein